MDIFLDTSILGRLADTGDPLRGQVTAALKRLQDHGHNLVYSHQVAREYAVVASRPRESANGLGFTPRQVAQDLDALERTFELKRPRPEEYEQFRKLHLELEPAGKKVHDLNLVATMKAHGVDALLTLDPGGFAKARQAGHISVYSPEQVLAAFPAPAAE